MLASGKVVLVVAELQVAQLGQLELLIKVLMVELDQRSILAVVAEVLAAAVDAATSDSGGAGGNGVATSITGSSVTYAGGGGGSG
jgi:hypothetical protein